ncbi:hypothetical protein KP509_26G052300 [Ceratopteris richardii]|uniref:Uncharacterized protein n=1 Tax=Ceratopteris richardii TaxID=49495 RepID=A0A8T2RM05_CERRI|nr:hypothetical protein KP509_26G052300 [Ceratopteris richardii]
MPLASDRSHLRCRKRILLGCTFLFQLAWILPCAFLFLSQNATPRTRVLQDQNLSRKILTQGFSGSINLLDSNDLRVLNKIYRDWNIFLPRLKESFSSRGLISPSERSCFIWLPECFSFGKQKKILQVVEEVIGPKVLLYGMTVWKGRNEALQRFHRNAEILDCDKLVNFVYGANVQLVSQTHKLPERLLQTLLKNLLNVEEESSKFSNKQDELEFLQRSFVARVKRILRSQNVQLENLELNDNGGVFFHGGTLHRLGESLENGTGLLLQFISADCKVREPQNSGWRSQGTSNNLYLPPTLLVAGDGMKFGAVNDVRVSLSQEDGLVLKLDSRKKHLGKFITSHSSSISGDGVELSEMNSITVFSEANATSEWKREGAWRKREIGSASTSVMMRGKLELLSLEGTSSLDFVLPAGDGEQVIVMLSEDLLYFRVVTEGEFRHYELLELRPGSAVLMSKNLWQAFVPLSSETEMVTLHWTGRGQGQISGEIFDSKVMKAQLSNISSKHPAAQATEGRTITLTSGQAYDPDNNEFCDVIVFMVEGYLLQVLPSNVTLQAFEVLLIPAGQSCILWNIGGSAVKFFAMHLCSMESDMDTMMSFGASGKVF